MIRLSRVNKGSHRYRQKAVTNFRVSKQALSFFALGQLRTSPLLWCFLPLSILIRLVAIWTECVN